MSQPDAKRRCCGKTYAAKPPHREITGLESYRQAGGAKPRPGSPVLHPK